MHQQTSKITKPLIHDFHTKRKIKMIIGGKSVWLLLFPSRDQYINEGLRLGKWHRIVRSKHDGVIPIGNELVNIGY